MQANYVQRLRIVFSKIGPARYIGHLDLARTLERSFIRAGIPIAYSQGYNRRPRMQLASALPLGFTSECEIADIWLTEMKNPNEIEAKLSQKIAPGLIVHNVKQEEISAPALQTLIVEAFYVATLTETVSEKDLTARIESVLSSKSLKRERRGKQYDLRPLIHSLSMTKIADNCIRLNMRLSMKPGETGRPDEVIAALSLNAASARIHRTELVLSDEVK